MKLLEAAINRYLALDPEAPAKLADFDGKVICLDIIGLPRKLYLLPHGEQIHIETEHTGEVDATLRGSPLALFKMGMMRNVAPMLLKGEVEIIGDMRTGRAFKSLLAEIQIDWEEHLSQLTGDVAAHEIMKVADGFAHWGKRAAESMALNVGEYLQEESRDVVSGAEIEQFCDDIDALRSDTDRLKARIDRMTGAGI